MFSFNRKTLQTLLGGVFCILAVAIGSAAQVKRGVDQTRVKTGASPRSIVVKQIDLEGLRKVLTPSGKPLLVNLWATWCDPCRDEFPDLVKLDAEYKGKIDFITISLDELSEINRDVPRFLSEMRAEMPAYLLKTVDDDAAIAMISSDFTGALPFTVLYDASGKLAYIRQGKIRPEVVREEIDKLLNAPRPAVP